MQINTLVKDIQHIVTQKGGWFNDAVRLELSADLAARLQEQFGPRAQRATLRLSQMGPRCPRALWYSIHAPECAEPLPPWAEVKFAFGHVIESLAIAFAKGAGHEVTGEQDHVEVDGIVGHRDCVIDGCIVDVKSTSSFGFKKFKDGSLRNDDSFGYLDQLDGYLVGSLDDPLVRVKDRAYLLAIDKTLGHMCLYEHHIRRSHIEQRIKDYKEIVSLKEPPKCNCGIVPEGKSGNLRLDTKASYSAFKHICFPNLRTFLYSSGPVFFTRVVRVPDVQELFDKPKQLGYTIH